MPGSYGISDRVCKYTVEIEELKETLETQLKNCFYELNRLNKYIESIDDSQTRLVMSLRYIHGLTWKDIATRIGGNTEDSVKKMAYRYMMRN